MLNRSEVQKRIIEKCLKDPKFKKKFLSEPKEAMKELFTSSEINYSFVDKAKIKFVEEGKNELVLVLPHLPENTSHLSKKELENISAAGGCLTSFNCG